jgi:hypothetical protein
VSTIPALNSIGSGDTHDQALAHIQEVLDNTIGDYKEIAAQLPKAGFRVPDKDQKNLSDLLHPRKGYIEDPANKIWDANHQKMVNGYGPIPIRGDWPFSWKPPEGQSGAAPGATPSPTPVSQEIANAAPRPKTQADLDAIKSGTLFWDLDGKLKSKP